MGTKNSTKIPYKTEVDSNPIHLVHSLDEVPLKFNFLFCNEPI
jgi:hypothetical protein